MKNYIIEPPMPESTEVIATSRKSVKKLKNYLVAWLVRYHEADPEHLKKLEL